MKKLLILTLKVVAPVLLIAWLLSRLDEQQLEALRQRPVNWPLAGSAVGLMMLSTGLSFVRWYLLVRALALPFTLRDAFRLGILGFLMNFVSIGSMGGDLFKAIFVAREQPRQRTQAVATVVVDRMVGLFGLIMVTALAIGLLGISRPSPELLAIRRVTYLAVCVGAVGLVVLMMPGFTSSPLIEALTSIPKLGGPIERLVAALRMYRRQPGLLAFVCALSMLIHVFAAIEVYLLAKAIFSAPPTLKEHLIIVPLGNAAGALPFTPAGLGSYELAMDTLYRLLPDRPTDASGVTIALAHRLVTIAVAAIGVIVYWSNRREIAQINRQVEQSMEESAT